MDCSQAFDLLPNLIDVLKDVMSASSSQETTRIGDISASVGRGSGFSGRWRTWSQADLGSTQAVAIKNRYKDALELLHSLPGTDTSLEEQEAAIAQAKKELKRVK